MQLSTLSSWALLIWQTLNEHGYDAAAIFKQVGLDPAMLSDSNARYPLNKMHDLWGAVDEVSKDEAIGIEIGRHWGVTTFHALGFAWLASRSLHMGLQRLSRYSRIINSAMETEVHAVGSTYHVSFHTATQGGEIHPLANDAAHTALNRMCRMLCGEQFRPLEVRAMRPKTSISLLLETEVQAPYVLNADDNIWVFDRLDVERSLPTGNPALAHANEELALDYLNHLDQNDTGNRVRHYITHHLPSGPVTQEQVAKALNMSVRSLQRRLDDEGVNFATMLSDIRQELANTYVRNSRLSLNEIAYLLGFSEPASFTRAFRRWHGVSPSQFRQEVVAKTVA